MAVKGTGESPPLRTIGASPLRASKRGREETPKIPSPLLTIAIPGGRPRTFSMGTALQSGILPEVLAGIDRVSVKRFPSSPPAAAAAKPFGEAPQFPKSLEEWLGAAAAASAAPQSPTGGVLEDPCRAPPPAPKRGRGQQDVKNVYRVAARKASSGQICIGDTYRLTGPQSGDFQSTFHISEPGRFVMGVPCEEVVVKVFHGKQNPSDRQMKSWEEVAHAQYERMSAAGLNVPRRLSEPGIGYAVWEGVAHRWNDGKLWADPAVTVESLLPVVQARLASLRGFVEYAVETGDAVDLSWDNFRIREGESGKLVLIDFREEKDDGFACTNTGLRKICLGNPSVFEFLTANIRESNPDLCARMKRIFEYNCSRRLV